MPSVSSLPWDIILPLTILYFIVAIVLTRALRGRFHIPAPRSAVITAAQRGLYQSDQRSERE